ncbi:MAG: TlyA family RNA methyltransferase [Agrococcus casei]|uniref:TlyA family RNA methyltransferase n=1 Tax=Agrococcus casei TaxID=343512 RepID=UPI003F8FF746
MRLDVALAARGLARSRSHARQLIDAGSVLVDGAHAKAGAQVDDQTVLEVAEDRYVSRGAQKLLRALDVFGVDVRGRSAIDVGASTGGFTQVLLERGAQHVTALDVGHGQFALPNEVEAGRVRLLEGTNVRDVAPGDLDAAIDLVVTDISFISVAFIFEPLAAALPGVADWVLLIKPQFEVGRGSIGDGVVRDAALRENAVGSVVEAAAGFGLALRGLAKSPIAGAKGNVEYLARFVNGAADATQWRAMFATTEGGAEACADS